MNMIKTSLAVALASLGLNAQAAHFQITGPSTIGGYTYAEASIKQLGTASTDAQVEDLSSDQALLGIGALNDGTSEGGATVSYDWVREVTLDAASDPSSVGFTIGGTSVLGFDGVPGLQGVVEVSSITLNTTLTIASDGEAAGSAIRMLISGTAESLFSASLAVIEPDTTFSLIASWGGKTVSYTGNGAADAFDLSLDTVIGAEIALSLSYTTRAGWVGDAIDIPAGNSIGFDDSGLMSGSLSLAPVPEPEQYALLLAGLGLIGCAARRRA
ncbi:PEP-CTERM sorting domain-containing protein [Methyloversatilis thermotolerans]|uniref:PEP-CTERM sorting domain-containing protein n=1 Tax=Methyloversatilis thermotolerans TaxID=1346290 RepID=UPI00037EE847|nr:PEP-CTERM sorting domain-containing protein [Methyloversatilis thermotolerans]